MPQIEQINSTTYRIASGRDAIEIGNIDDIQCLAHLRHKRWHGNSEFVLSYPGSPTGVVADIAKGTLTIEYGDVDIELTAHEPDSDNPDGRSEFNVILKSKPTPDINGDYWQVLDFESTGLKFERVLRLDEEWSQERCYEKWYLDLYDNHLGNDLYGHDNGTGIFVRTSTEIRTPDGEIVLKSKPEHLVHSLLGTAIKNTHKKSNMGEIKANTPNKGKQLIYATISRDHVRLPKRELVDARGKKARIEDVQLIGNKLWFKLPKAFIEKAKYPIRHATGVDPAYTEDMDNWVTDYGSDSTWEDYDLFTNKGVPKGAVAEIIIANQEAGYEADLGIRTDGSSLARKIWIHEAEAGGVTTCRMFVVCHADTGLVETHADDVSDDNIFYLVGYWENVGFTERFDTESPSSSNIWSEEILLVGSNAASRICHFLLRNQEDNTSNRMGVRDTSSAVDRNIRVHEPENGGGSILDMLTKADASHSVDCYSQDNANTVITLAGYFGSEMDFVEGFDAILDSSETNQWETKDVTAYLDQDGRVTDWLLVNETINMEVILGIRGGDDSATLRVIIEHEAEDNGGSTGEGTGFGISAKTNALGKVQMRLSSGVGTIASAYLMGYFKPSAGEGETYEMSCSDGIVAGDTPAGQLTIDITVSDGIKGGDTPAGIGIFLKIAADGIKGSDTPTTQAVLQNIVADGIVLSDTALAGLVYHLLAADGIKLSDIASIFKTIAETVGDGIKGSDIPVTQLEAQSVIGDGVKLSDTPTAQAILQNTASDGIVISDTPITQAVLQSLVADGIVLSDTPLAGLVYQLLTTDGIKLSDTPVGELIYQLLASDGVVMGDTATIIKVIAESLVDGIKASDTPLTQAILQAIAGDGVKLSDTPVTSLILSLLTSDGVKLSDTAAYIQNLFISLADGIKASDTPLANLVLDLIAADGLKLSDTSVISLILSLALADGITLSDTNLAEIMVLRLLKSLIEMRVYRNVSLEVRAYRGVELTMGRRYNGV